MLGRRASSSRDPARLHDLDAPMLPPFSIEHIRLNDIHDKAIKRVGVTGVLEDGRSRLSAIR